MKEIKIVYNLEEDRNIMSLMKEYLRISETVLEITCSHKERYGISCEKAINRLREIENLVKEDIKRGIIEDAFLQVLSFFKEQKKKSEGGE